jgi:hypothetical protein
MISNLPSIQQVGFAYSPPIAIIRLSIPMQSSACDETLRLLDKGPKALVLNGKLGNYDLDKISR